MEERMINGGRFYVHDVPGGAELDTVALGMLEQNEIKGLLPFRMIQQDKDRSFRYDAQKGIPLAKWLEKVRSRKEVLELTASILEAAEESERYLLETDHLCTRIPYLMMEDNQCRIAYIPLSDYKEGSLTELVHQIWEKIRYAQDEDYTYIFDLLNAFGRGEVREISELRRWIRMLQSGETPQRQTKGIEPVMRSESPVMWSGSSAGQSERPVMQSDIPILQPEGLKARKEEGKADKKHRFFGAKKKQEKGIAMQVGMLPEQDHPMQPVKKKYYNEIKDNDRTVLVTPEENGYLLRPGSGEEYLLENSSYVIGSSDQADICIRSNSAVSRKHAEIGKDENGGYYIRDLNSTNGTYVNGEKLEPGRKHELYGTARIKLANEELSFEVRRR